MSEGAEGDGGRNWALSMQASVLRGTSEGQNGDICSWLGPRLGSPLILGSPPLRHQ